MSFGICRELDLHGITTETSIKGEEESLAISHNVYGPAVAA